MSLETDRTVSRLYREYGPVVYRRCLRLLHDRAAAEDATQEVFVKLLRAMGRLQDPGTVLPWIFRVATNHCLNVLRNAHTRGVEPLAGDVAMVPDPSADGPAGYLERQLAQAVLSRFDEKTQAVAVGVFVDGMELGEIASLIGISRRTVSRKLASFVANSRKFLLHSTIVRRVPGGASRRDTGVAVQPREPLLRVR